MIALTVDTLEGIILASARIIAIMCVTSAEDTAQFAFTYLADVIYPITRKANLNFGDKRVNFMACSAKENIFRQKLSNKFQANGARRDIFVTSPFSLILFKRRTSTTL